MPVSRHEIAIRGRYNHRIGLLQPRLEVSTARDQLLTACASMAAASPWTDCWTISSKSSCVNGRCVRRHRSHHTATTSARPAQSS
jgi:hypothetical protein